MTQSIPTHSGSRWEPVQSLSASPVGDRVPTESDATGPRRAVRGPRMMIAAVLSVLALGGTGTTIALARSTQPEPSVTTTRSNATDPVVGRHTGPARR